MSKLIKVLSILLAVMMVVSLSACGEKKQAENTQSSAVTTQETQATTEAPKEKLKFKFFSFSTEDTRKGINQYIQDTAKAAFPDYDFEFEISGQDASDKLKVYNSSGEIPDILFTDYATLDPIIKAGNVIDLLPYIKAEKFDEKYEFSTPIEPGADGKLYAMNTGADNLFTPRIFYRKDILAKYGIAVPKTWDEFLSACKTLKQNNIIPMTSYGTNGWLIMTCLFQQMIMNENPQVVNDLIDGKTDLNNPVSINALNKAGLLFKEGYFAPGLLTLDYGGAEQLFKDNKAAMYIMFTWAVPDFNDIPDVDIMLWPSANPDIDSSKNIQVWGGPMNGYAGSSKNLNSEAVAKLVMWCTMQEATYMNKERKSPTALKTGVTIEGLSPLAQKNMDLFNAAPNKFRTITNFGFKPKLDTEFKNNSQKLMTGKYTGEEFVKNIMPFWTENYTK